MTQLILIGHESVRFSHSVSDKEIRRLVKEETNFAVRRLDNFTLISLNAVYRLESNYPSSKSLALYSGAEYMSVDLFQSVIKSMHAKEAIRPFDFIATVGNAANFYLAKEFNIKGPNIFIGASEKIFLKNSLLAETDLNLGHSQQVIIVVWLLTEGDWVCHAFKVEPRVFEKELTHQSVLPRDNFPIDLDVVCIDDLLQKSEKIPCPAILNTDLI